MEGDKKIKNDFVFNRSHCVWFVAGSLSLAHTLSLVLALSLALSHRPLWLETR